MANYFSIILTALTVATGLIWLADAMLWAPKRKEKIALAQSSTQGDIDPETLNKIAPLPVIVDNAQQIFPVIAFVLILRSFLYEPFQIPSGSMKPTLLVGDFILVEKFSYGLRDPVARKKFLELGSPERGDIVVFKYPPNPSQDFIKRLIGMPGDTVIYRNKQFTIKPACDVTKQTACEPERTMPLSFLNRDEFFFGATPLERFEEQLGDVNHDILRNPLRPDSTGNYYRQPGTRIGEWIVPEGHYFMIGDNRDNSGDSRFWGFVPEDNLVGKAVAIWISFEFDRAPSSWVPGWIPTGVRFNRVGGIH
jgi:signal peptidase I